MAAELAAWFTPTVIIGRVFPSMSALLSKFKSFRDANTFPPWLSIKTVIGASGSANKVMMEGVRACKDLDVISPMMLIERFESGLYWASFMSGERLTTFAEAPKTTFGLFVRRRGA